MEKHIKDMEILITTPFHPAYMSKERIQKAEKLKLIMTAGVGSDHIDLQAAADKGMTVVEVTGVLLHKCMTTLLCLFLAVLAHCAVSSHCMLKLIMLVALDLTTLTCRQLPTRA